MTASGLDQRSRWARWTQLLVHRVPLPYPVTIALGSLVLLAEQIWEESIGDPGLVGLAALPVLLSRLSIPLVFLYAMLMIRLIRNAAMRELALLQPSVQLSPAEYDDYVRRMVHTSRKIEVVLGLASVAIQILLWPILGLPLPVDGTTPLPHGLLAACFVVASYAMFSWAGLTLIVATAQFGTALGSLARRPLTINVFDPENVLPFGRLSVRLSVAAAGVVLILLATLGAPVTALAWFVVTLASLTSLSALLLPLWGVHQQMAEARSLALAHVHRHFMECQGRLLGSSHAADNDLKAVSAHVETLTQLRKTLLGAATWPFRDMGAALRALIASMSPLVYVVMTEAIRAYLKNFIR